MLGKPTGSSKLTSLREAKKKEGDGGDVVLSPPTASSGHDRTCLTAHGSTRCDHRRPPSYRWPTGQPLCSMQSSPCRCPPSDFLPCLLKIFLPSFFYPGNEWSMEVRALKGIVLLYFGRLESQGIEGIGARMRTSLFLYALELIPCRPHWSSCSWKIDRVEYHDLTLEGTTYYWKPLGIANRLEFGF